MTDQPVGYTELIHDNDKNIALLAQSVKNIDKNVNKLLTAWEGNGSIGYKAKIEKNITATSKLYWFLGVFSIATVLAIIFGG